MRRILGSIAALLALVLANKAHPHALSARTCPGVPVGKPWSKLSLPNRQRLTGCNYRHAGWALRFIKAHRSAYSPSRRRTLISSHRRLQRKAKANLAAIERALHPVYVVTWPWIAIVDCESGDGSGSPPYTADWGYNDGVFEGGPNFAPSTWRDYGGLAYAAHAYDATPEQQIRIAEKVLADVGWGAWPVCSVKVGLR